MPLRPSSKPSKTPPGGAAPRAPETPASAVPMLHPMGRHQGKAGMALTRSFTLIGSKPRAHLHLVSQSISGAHAYIVNTDTGLYIRDLASRTHVIVNGTPVLEADLHDGDLVALGSFTFKFSDASGKDLLGKPVPAPPAVLQVQGQVETFPITTRGILIGRRKTCNISLSGDDISTSHAVMFEMNGHRFIRDLGSRTGTFVNDVQVNGHKHALRFGDQIRIGDVVFVYASAQEQETAESLDELEDLVGTAPIGAEQPEAHIVAPPPPPPRPAARARPPTPVEAPALPSRVEPPRPARPAIPAARVAPPPLPPRRELDLDAEAVEPDLAEPADDTVALPQAPTPRFTPPALSPQVVDEPDELDLSALEWEPHGSADDGAAAREDHHPEGPEPLDLEPIPLDLETGELPLDAGSVEPLAAGAVPEDHHATLAPPPLAHHGTEDEPGLEGEPLPFDDHTWATSDAAEDELLPAHDELSHDQHGPGHESVPAETDLSAELGLSPNVFGFTPAEPVHGETPEHDASHEAPHGHESVHDEAALAGEHPEHPAPGTHPAPDESDPSFGLDFLDESAGSADVLHADAPEAPAGGATLAAPPPLAPPTIAAPADGDAKGKKKSWVSGLFGRSNKPGQVPSGGLTQGPPPIAAPVEPEADFEPLPPGEVEAHSALPAGGPSEPADEFADLDFSEVDPQHGEAHGGEGLAGEGLAGEGLAAEFLPEGPPAAPVPVEDWLAEEAPLEHVTPEHAHAPQGPPEHAEAPAPIDSSEFPGLPHALGESDALLEAAASEDAEDLSWLDGEFPADFGAAMEGPELPIDGALPVEFEHEAHEPVHTPTFPSADPQDITGHPVAGQAHDTGPGPIEAHHSAEAGLVEDGLADTALPLEGGAAHADHEVETGHGIAGGFTEAQHLFPTAPGLSPVEGPAHEAEAPAEFELTEPSGEVDPLDWDAGFDSIGGDVDSLLPEASTTAPPPPHDAATTTVEMPAGHDLHAQSPLSDLTERDGSELTVSSTPDDLAAGLPPASAADHDRPIEELADEVLSSDGFKANGIDDLPADFFSEDEVESTPVTHPAGSVEHPGEPPGHGAAIEHGVGAIEAEHGALELEPAHAPELAEEFADERPAEPAGHAGAGHVPAEAHPQADVSDFFATSAITEAIGEEAGRHVHAEAESHAPAAAPVESESHVEEHEPLDPYAFPEVMSPEKDLSDSIFDVDVPASRIVPQIEQAPGSTGAPHEFAPHAPAAPPAESMAHHPGIGPEAAQGHSVLEGEILEPEVIEPEFGESRPYLPQFLDGHVVDRPHPTGHEPVGGHQAGQAEGRAESVGHDTISLVPHDSSAHTTVSGLAGSAGVADDRSAAHGAGGAADDAATASSWLDELELDPDHPHHPSAGAEIVPPLPFDSGDALASEPLVPLTPQSHSEFVESESPEPLDEVGTDGLEELADLPGEPGELDELLDWDESASSAAEQTGAGEPLTGASVVQPPAIGPDAAVAVPPPQGFPTIAGEAPSPVPTVVPSAAPSTPASPAPSFNPMFGMSRDLASFIGGLPLALPQLTKPKLPFSQVAVTFDSKPGASSDFEQPLVGAMDLLSSSEPTVSSPSLDNHGGPVSTVNQTPTADRNTPVDQAGTLEGWGELPDLIEPGESFEEIEEADENAHPGEPVEDPIDAASPAAEELHSEGLEPQHPGAPLPHAPHQAATDDAFEELAFEELSAPEPHEQDSLEPIHFDELDELSGFGEAQGSLEAELAEPHEPEPHEPEPHEPEARSKVQDLSAEALPAMHPGQSHEPVFDDPASIEGLEWEPEFDKSASAAEHAEQPATTEDLSGAEGLEFEEPAFVAPPPRPTIRPPARTPPKKIGKGIASTPPAPGKIKPPLARAASKMPPRPGPTRPSNARSLAEGRTGASMEQADPFSVSDDDVDAIAADPAFGEGLAEGPPPTSNGARRRPPPPPPTQVRSVPPIPGARGSQAVAARPSSAALSQGARPGIKGARSAATALPSIPVVQDDDLGLTDGGLDDESTSAEQAAPAPARPGHRRLLLVLVGVVLLLTAAGVAAIVFWHIHNKTVRGAFQLKGSSTLTAAGRAELKGRQQQLLADPGLRALARNIAAGKGASGGFLGDSPKDAADFSALAGTADWDEKAEQLIFTRSGTDDSDKPRMSALLDALYRANRDLSDEAGRLRMAQDDAVRKAEEVQSRLEDLDRRARHDQDLAKRADMLGAAAAEVKASLEALVKDRDASDAKVRAAEADIKPLEPAVSVTQAPTTRSSGSEDASAAPADVNLRADDQVTQLTAELEQLNSSLKAAKDARDAQATQAATLLDAAQTQFDAQIQAARKAAGGDGVMAQFLTTLKDQEDLIHHLNDELIQQQKDQRQLLDKLKDDLAGDNAARIKQVWDEDTGPGINLRDLQQSMAVAEHRYNTAVAARLPEADGLKADMEQLDKQIKARQGLLASKDLYNPRVKKVQDAVDQLVAQMENNRARNEARLQEVLQGFEKERPETGKLPAEQRALAAQLDESSKALKQARAKYNQTQEEISARSDAIVQGLASQVAAQQVKIEDRKKQLIAAASQVPTPQQVAQLASERETGRQAEYQRKQEELAQARVAQAEAATKYDRAMQQFLTLAAQAQNAAEAGDRLTQEAAERLALMPQKQDADQQVQAVATRLHNVVDPQRPTASSVTVEGEDPRMTYLLWVICGGFSLTFILLLPLLLASHEPAERARHLPIGDLGPAAQRQAYGDHAIYPASRGYNSRYGQAREYDDQNDEGADEGYDVALTPAHAVA